METSTWRNYLTYFDARRDLILAGERSRAIAFCAEQFIQIGEEAIARQGIFTVALSGGSTPQPIYKELSQPKYKGRLDWNRVYFFWSDERSVSRDHPESNYFMSMSAGLETLPIPLHHVFPMEAAIEPQLEENARSYEENIRKIVPESSFDLVMLGMGDDGHTASLFPHTAGLEIIDRLVISNYVPQKKTWRMSFTFECLDLAKIPIIYVFGKNKSSVVEKALKGPYDPSLLPVQRVGTSWHKAIWILDEEAANFKK